ncbi:unnamed protein product [Brassica rapa subsp. narinosa]
MFTLTSLFLIERVKGFTDSRLNNHLPVKSLDLFHLYATSLSPFSNVQEMLCFSVFDLFHLNATSPSPFSSVQAMLCFSTIFTLLCFSVQEMLCFRSFENAAGDSLCIPMDATDDTLGPKSLVKTSEFIRLIIDALTSLGFNAIATELEKQSRIPLHNQAAKQFLELVNNQEWDKSIDALKPLELADENTVILLLLEQKEEITPLGLETRLLHKLASKILKPDPVGEEGTEVVKKKLLEYLLDDDLDTQRGECDFHNVPDSALSLFSYHYCDKRKIPSETLQVLSEHTDEVWFLTFSHDGKCLASSSKDKTAILWEMDADGKFTQKHKLCGPREASSSSLME